MRANLLKKMEKIIVTILMAIVVADVNTCCLFVMYQPKCPDDVKALKCIKKKEE